MTIVDGRRALRLRWVRRVAVLVVVLAVVAGLGTWGWRTLFPRMEASPGNGYGMDPVRQRPGMTFGLYACLDGRGRARIVDVRPIGATNGLQVRAFGVDNTGSNTLGGSYEPVSALAQFRSRTVRRDCSGEWSTLALQVDAPGYPARADGFEIDYVVHGLKRTATSGTFVELGTDSSSDE